MALEHFTAASFQEKVLDGKQTALVDFFAQWCGPCKMLTPVFEAVSEELGDTVLTGKVDIDEEESLTAKYGVMTVPTIILFKNGEEVKRLVGVQSKQTLLDLAGQA